VLPAASVKVETADEALEISDVMVEPAKKNVS
jgi:hypothetical protein